MALAEGKNWGDKVSDKGDKPILFDMTKNIGFDYWSAVNLAGQYASTGRNYVCNKVLEIIGGRAVEEIHNHHNFVWQEEHFGEKYYVVRKGCTPAFPGQLGFIGANMMDASVIVEGVESQESKEGLYSTVHGAGRILSRTQAAGKKKWIKGEDGKKRPQIVGKGIVDWESVQNQMAMGLKILRGGGPDEAPQCYKNLNEVLKYQGNTIRIKTELYPIIVCMAGDEYDPYKD